MHTLPAHSVRQMPRFIDLHQDMLSGVGRLAGGFPDYGASYLSGSSHATTILSSVYPHSTHSGLVGELDAHDALITSHSTQLRLVTTAEDLEAQDMRTGVLPHSEGMPLPGIAPDTLETLWAEHSLRSLALTWNHETDYAYSCYDSHRATLKPAGRKLVRTLEETPLLLDVAHINDGGFYDVLDTYAPPVLVTHTFCRALTHHPRGLADEQLRALGDHGGLVGLAFDPDFLGQGTVDEALRHIDRIASLAGEDAVSIGSDWGVAAMGHLRCPATLVSLLDAVEHRFGPTLAEKFAFANAFDFLRAQLPTRQ